MAVQAHPHDVSGLHNAILVSFNHCSSTDENSEHDRVGARSWGFYQKALATGQEPGPHRTNVGTPLAPDGVSFDFDDNIYLVVITTPQWLTYLVIINKFLLWAQNYV